MSKVYLVRHGQSEANLNRIWGGDFPLTKEGKSQASTVPGKIPVKPDKVVASMLKRVYSTAQIAYPDMEIEKDPVFNEVSFGDLDLCPMTKETIEAYHNDPEKFQIEFHGEDRYKRASEAIGEIGKYASENENTVIFLSNTLIVSIITVLLGKTLAETRRYYLKNCNVIVLDYDGALKVEDINSFIMIGD